MPAQNVHTLAAEAVRMAENEAQTMTVPVAVYPAATPPVTGQVLVGRVLADPGAVSAEPYAPQPWVSNLGETVPAPSAPRGFMARLRTPMAAAIAGGVLLLGIGFGTGFVVGHQGGGARAGTQGGPGEMNGGGPGFGQGRQGGTGTQQGQGFPGQSGGTQSGGTQSDGTQSGGIQQGQTGTTTDGTGTTT